MPLGNSITHGDMNHRTYRYHLWKLLRNDGHDIDFVGTSRTNHNGENPAQDFDQDHEGHWGWRADQFLRGTPEKQTLSDFLLHSRPDIVLMHLGSNDVFQGESIDQVTDELKEIISVLRSSNKEVVIFVAQILPVTNKAINTRIELLNSEIEQIPSSMGLTPRVVVVNQFEGFDPFIHTYDGIHPDEDGELKMAMKWYESLKPVLNR